MTDNLRRYMREERTPENCKNPHNWPDVMRAEWAEYECLAAVREHRCVLVDGFQRARQALDAFQPDLVLIWGDDQYENFKEDLVPPFAVYGLPEIPVEPYKASPVMLTRDNVWGQPEDVHTTWAGHPEAA